MHSRVWSSPSQPHCIVYDYVYDYVYEQLEPK